MRSRILSLLLKLKMFPVKYLLNRSQAKAAIEADVDRFVQFHNRSRSGEPVYEKLVWIWNAPSLEEFRYLFYFRIGTPSHLVEILLLALSKAISRPRMTMSISCHSIGPGFVIMHGAATVVEAEKIGKYCLVFQETVIGYKNESADVPANDRPTIGDFVHISTGAKVLGKITIGDHAVIAANTVVTKDMPPNSLAVGVPARIIKDAGNKADYIAHGIISA
jgi:serine O-acetyltransferase